MLHGMSNPPVILANCCRLHAPHSFHYVGLHLAACRPRHFVIVCAPLGFSTGVHYPPRHLRVRLAAFEPFPSFVILNLCTVSIEASHASRGLLYGLSSPRFSYQFQTVIPSTSCSWLCFKPSSLARLCQLEDVHMLSSAPPSFRSVRHAQAWRG